MTLIRAITPRSDRNSSMRTDDASAGTPAAPRSPGSSVRIVLVAAVLAALTITAPFLLTQTPALIDYPNHLARVFILNNWHEDPSLQAYYQLAWGVLPNLGFDLAGSALAHVVSIFPTGQIILIAAIVMMLSGVLAVSAALHGGTPRLFSVFGSLFVTSQPFMFGFINLMLGFGLALWGIASWLRLRARPLPLVLVCFVPFALLLFFVHLFAFAAYGVVLAGIEITVLARARWTTAALKRVTVLAASQLAIPACLLLFASPTPVSSSAMGDQIARLRTIVMAPFRNESDVLDVAAFLAVVTLIVVGFLARRLLVAREMRLPLIMLAVLCLLMPNTLATSSNGAMRLPVFFCLLLAASGSWRTTSRPLVAVGAAAFAVLLAARAGVVAASFVQGAGFVAEVRQALVQVPRGARIAAMTVTSPEAHRTRAEWLHVICYAVIDRSAFVPSLFAFAEQQPVNFTPRMRGLAYPPEQFVSRPGQPLQSDVFANLDYLMLINPTALRTALPDDLTLMASGREFNLYAVRR